MDTKNFRYLQRPRTEKKCKQRLLNPNPKEESRHTLSQGMQKNYFPWQAKPGFKTSFPLFRSIWSNSLRRNEAKDNPTRTFCTIYIKLDESTSSAKLRLLYCFQNKDRLFESEWTKGFFGKADKTFNKIVFRRNPFLPDEPIRA